MRFAHTLLTAALIGFALSCALLAGLLVYLLARYSKDIAETQFVYEYIQTLIIAACLSFAAARLCRHRSLKERL